MNELVPDYWGFDAINSYGSFTELAQYWYQQEIIDDRLMVKFGKIDANVDFAVPCTGTNFVNSAAYFPGALVVNMPTYPLQAGGVEILTKPFENFDARFGFLMAPIITSIPERAPLAPTRATVVWEVFFGITQVVIF